MAQNESGHRRLELWIQTIEENGYQVKLKNSIHDHWGRDIAQYVISNHTSQCGVLAIMSDTLQTFIEMNGSTLSDDVEIINQSLKEN